jgi:hypothetical protein
LLGRHRHADVLADVINWILKRFRSDERLS